LSSHDRRNWREIASLHSLTWEVAVLNERNRLLSTVIIARAFLLGRSEYIANDSLFEEVNPCGDESYLASWAH